MSILATNWVWSLALPPTPKLILMALADEADDDGYCWPSVRRISKKAGVSERTVRRAIAAYGDSELLQVSTRIRADGGQSSNSYRLSLTDTTLKNRAPEPPNDNLSPPVARGRGRRSPASARPLPRQCQGVPATAVSGHYPLQDPPERSTTTTATVQANLAAPSSLSTEDAREAILTVAARISDEGVAQQLLDELDAKVQARAIKGAWQSYFLGLIRKAEEGAFFAAAGRAIAKRREEETKKTGTPTKKLTPASPEAARAHIARCQAELRGRAGEKEERHA